MASTGKKQYGLIKKSETTAPKIKSVFADSDEDNGSEAVDWVMKSLNNSKTKSAQRNETSRIIRQALEEDTKVFAYDEVYESFNENKSSQDDEKVKSAPKPRYMDKLLKSADRRKREQERRIERTVQREREAEGEQFTDKEVFVTSAYKKKMEEQAAEEAEERRKQQLDKLTDVTKQKDLSGFYRHLYRETVNKPDNEKKEEEIEDNYRKFDVEKRKDEKRHYRKRHDSSHSDSDNDLKNDEKVRVASERRQFRKRSGSTSANSDSEQLEKTSSSSDEINKEREIRAWKKYTKDTGKRDSKIMKRDKNIEKVQLEEKHKSSRVRRSESHERKRHHLDRDSEERSCERSNYRCRKSYESSQDRQKASSERLRGRERKSESFGKGYKVSRDRSRDKQRRSSERIRDDTRSKDKKKENSEEKRMLLNTERRHNRDKEDKTHDRRAQEENEKKDSVQHRSYNQENKNMETMNGHEEEEKKEKDRKKIERQMEIYDKRTVGGVFENGVKKYMMRKAQRQGMAVVKIVKDDDNDNDNGENMENGKQ